jgi:beta-lactamase class A
MIEVFKQAKAGKFKLSDSILINNEFKSIVDGSTFSLTLTDDSGEQLYQKIGQKTLISDLVYEMITVSSNLATNILIERVAAKKVNQTMRNLGAEDIQILRGVEDNKAFQKGLNNTVTAYDLMLIYEKLALGEVVDKAACQEMIHTLMDQKFNEIIPAKLPKEVKVAHKTGEITGVRHDSGIVYLPDGRKYILILLSKNLKDTEAGIRTMATISAMIYQYMVQ